MKDTQSSSSKAPLPKKRISSSDDRSKITRILEAGKFIPFFFVPSGTFYS